LPYCAEADPGIKSKQIFNHKGEITDMLDTACRTCQRVKINKGISYNGLDVNSNVVERYMGVALNVSQNGIQLETDRMIDARYIILMFFDYRSNYVAARGEVIYSRKKDSGKFWTGISLQGRNGDNLQFVKKLIQSYHYQKSVQIFVS
jgi:hypothetical protein